MKRFFIAILLLLSLLLTGCSSETTSIISEVNTASEFSMSYTSFTGTRTSTISISDSATATVTGVLTTRAGNLSIKITDETENIIFAANDVSEAASFSVSLTGPGEYTITVSADAHTGSFSFTWEIIGAAVQSEAVTDTRSSTQDADSEKADSDSLLSTIEDESDSETSGSTSSEETDSEETASDAGTSSAALAPDWNGIFRNDDNSISLEFWLADSSSCEFAFTKGDSILMGVARIDLEAPANASWTSGDAIVSFVWNDSETLTVTVSGAAAALALDPSGIYTFSEMN